ncbi:MAG: DNA/RNA nuclease SfsA [Gammaproteobacteria bacterium]|nr:DNA/RNA nuclease SfsA [Gammaproteobacteria bacterium]
MRFEPPLLPGVLVRRYKRFLADVEIAGRGVVTMHCANTGAMLGCDTPGSRVWFSTSFRPQRKYAHTLEIVETAAGDRIGVNTARANTVVAQALAGGRISELRAERIRREVRIPETLAGEHKKAQRAREPLRGRFDFGLYGASTDQQPSAYVEVKSVTLARGNLGAFPDAVSERARRHVEALARCVAIGSRGVLLYCVPHTAIRRVTPADDIDPEYGCALRRAADAGVEVIAYGCTVSPQEITLDGALEVVL